MFHSKAEIYQVRRPKIHLVINNRTTRYNLRSANAFQDMADSNIVVLFEAYQTHRECFVPCEQSIHESDIDSFKKQYFDDIQYFHTTGILSLHTGCPLAKLSGNVHLYDVDVGVKRQQVDSYLPHIERLVNKL